MAEVKFVAEITDPLTRERKLCKIKCVEGQWIGPLCEHKDGKRAKLAPLAPLAAVPRSTRRSSHRDLNGQSQQAHVHGGGLSWSFVASADGGRFHPILRSCLIENVPSHVVLTYRNVSIQVRD